MDRKASVSSSLAEDLTISQSSAKYTKSLSIGTPTAVNSSFVPNGKLMVLGVLISKHNRVFEFVILGYFFLVSSIKHCGSSSEPPCLLQN